MREALFIKKNADKWKEYQHSRSNDPDETAERFITLIDDLSYAKTFYPGSKVTRWINGIAAGIYQSIYKNKKEKFSRVFTFWKFELPLLFKRYHRILLFTFLLEVFIVCIGVWGSLTNEEFMRNALPPGYVDMTQENIAKGDPFGVYKDDNLFSMFVYIAMNNIFVALLMVIGGVALGIWTMISVWKNGIMLGAFQFMFFKNSLGWQSVLVIWIHGTIEILSFIVAATAGFIITQSIIFPGTFSRLKSFIRGIKDALKIMIVLVPLFIIAAFLETYVTHLMSQTFDKAGNSGLPVWAGVLILVASLAFLAWYFIFLPIRLHKKGYYIQPDGIINRLNQEHA